MPSVVWLNALDYAHGRCWNSTDVRQVIRGPILFGETRLIGNDGERHPPLLAVGHGDIADCGGLGDEFPSNVVKRSAQVGDEIPDYARQARRWLGCKDTFDTYAIPLKFGDDFIGLLAYVPPA